MRAAAKIVFALYLLLLVWLVVFKLSFNLSVSVFDHYTRSLNLIPFAHASRSDYREMLYNIVVFVPFGVLLGINLKRATSWRNLALVCIFSLAIETLQFVLAIGISDVTDVITNTAGGFLGLLFYDAARKYVDEEKLDRFMLIVGTILLIVCIVPIGFLFSHHLRFR